jgi:hypothetical protein
MAITAAGAHLTATHQAAQARQAAVLAYFASRLFLKTVDPADIDTSAARWLAELIPRLLRERSKSTDLGVHYYDAFRKAEHVGGVNTFVPVDYSIAAIETSLRVTGPVALKDRIGRIPPGASDTLRRAMIDQAVQQSADGAAAAAMRHVQAGGRDAVAGAVELDESAVGWARVTKSAKPCYFCAMLASRGFVYTKESFELSDNEFVGAGDVKVHDSCQCTIEPRFDLRDPLPGRAEEFTELWGSATRGKSGRAAINAFRRAYEGR